jgi:glutamate dehydrogenase
MMLESKDFQTEELQQALTSRDAALYRQIERALGASLIKASENLDWLYANMHPYFFITMKEDLEAIVNLSVSLRNIEGQLKVTLIDQEDRLIVARLNLPGSVYATLKTLQEREISYAEMGHSYGPLPGSKRELEFQKFEFQRKGHLEVSQAKNTRIPRDTKKAISGQMKEFYPDFDFKDLDRDLSLLWVNNPDYVRISPAERVARILWLYQQAKRHDGLYLDVEQASQDPFYKESRLLFSVGNPPQRGFMTQISEIFQRLDIGVRRSYSLLISTGIHPYFLGTFYVIAHGGKLIEKGSELFKSLQAELYNTQVLSTSTNTYRNFVTNRMMSGEEASLTNALIAFCHTTLAQASPDRFDLGTVKSAFQSDADMTLKIIQLFNTRFDPDLADRESLYQNALAEAVKELKEYNTGQRYLDEIRKEIFRTALSFVQRTLKTNFFVPEKHALAFRLDPDYLSDLGPEYTEKLPEGKPFRITFFFVRYAVGYHIGFSDIARGGWRTVICRTDDEMITNSNTLFKEVFVLAHTQHLKNKDIYEGGSKLVILLDARGEESPDDTTQRLYKVQYGVLNAFLDIFVTEDGKPKNPRVLDYYGDDEPIEIGPDENLHDNMIELIAKQAVKRGYMMGIGIISSKRIGINHKEYGVTSRGVVKSAEIAMKQIGIDINQDPFTVRFTGGPNGDVAGNSMRLILERCPQGKILSIVDGTAGLFDPEGADPAELSRVVLHKDLDAFNPEGLHTGGFILFRGIKRQEGLRSLYRKVIKTPAGVEESWITLDEFQREIGDLMFSTKTDLFLPCGGRPDTIDESNWSKLFPEGGEPTVRVITEGANSFITPTAREEIQKQGVIIVRDASANKCGVISSSYEILANLLMTEKEFLAHKEEYVADVLQILEKRAQSEAELIFRRYTERKGTELYTRISQSISTEINEHYGRLFEYFQGRPELADQPLFERVIVNHLPAFIGKNKKFRRRVKAMPPKIKFAILASELASHIVYKGGWEMDFEHRLQGYIKEQFN